MLDILTQGVVDVLVFAFSGLIVLLLLSPLLNLKSKDKKNQPKVNVHNVTKELQSRQLEGYKKLGQISDKTSLKHKPCSGKPNLFTLEFDGDTFASQVELLREEISTLLLIADPTKDEVLVKLKSPGGTVNGYGLVASQLKRIVNANLRLTVSVDQMAASGGYLAACVANKIIAAPFAYIGSIGVVAEFPHFKELMDKVGIKYHQFTAGPSKRLISPYRDIEDAEAEEFQKELEDVHSSFIKHVTNHRSSLILEQDEVFSGKTWLGHECVTMGLCDDNLTSDEYILNYFANPDNGDIIRIETQLPRDPGKFIDKLVLATTRQLSKVAPKGY